MNKRQWEIESALLETLKQQVEEQLEARKALLSAVETSSMSQAELEKYLDALELHEKQQFNAAMAEAKAQGLLLH
jgi:hypothetical protein